MASEAAPRPVTAEALGQISYEAAAAHVGTAIPWQQRDPSIRAFHEVEVVAVAVAVLGVVIQRVDDLQTAAMAEARAEPDGSEAKVVARARSVGFGEVLVVIDALAREVAQ